MTRQQLSLSERDLTVGPVHPPAQVCGWYQHPDLLVSAIHGRIRVVYPSRSQGHHSRPQRCENSRRFPNGPHNPTLTLGDPLLPGIEGVMEFERQEVGRRRRRPCGMLRRTLWTLAVGRTLEHQRFKCHGMWREFMSERRTTRSARCSRTDASGSRSDR